MLKNKLQSLIARQHLAEENNFEIIHDANALNIIGGVGSCSVLTSCGTYTGGCPNLATCGTYTPPD